MLVHLHNTYYDAKATLLSEADIKEIRESRGVILFFFSQPVLDENFQTNKIK
ncbi:6922_t:CDS:2 [Funneliformis geosporum]|uniref:6922_t:CDS:1 n=1 Tax=Funneliformis geosporum TaxID=1117311 RepID=A0A9W4SN63_9GLOM|nr:6922_t:CDS:2 [Funneliformis geosporum]